MDVIEEILSKRYGKKLQVLIEENVVGISNDLVRKAAGVGRNDQRRDYFRNESYLALSVYLNSFEFLYTTL